MTFLPSEDPDDSAFDFSTLFPDSQDDPEAEKDPELMKDYLEHHEHTDAIMEFSDSIDGSPLILTPVSISTICPGHET